MNLNHFVEHVLYNVQANLKIENKRYALSYLWWVIEPILHFIILYIVFGIYFGNSDSDYIPFLFCGLVPWFWFSKSISHGLDSILSGQHIIKDIYIPKYFFPTVSILQSTIKEFTVIAILIIILVLSGVYPTLTWLYLPIIIILQFIFIASLVYFLAILVPYFLDLKYVIVTLLQIIMFASGTFYDYKAMPEYYQSLFLLNPMALIINMYRDTLMYHQSISVIDCAYILFISIILGTCSFFLYKKLDKEIPKVLFR